MVYSNCTLHIKELTKDDSADYVLVEGGAGFSNMGNVTIKVEENLPKPNVIVKPTNFLMEFQPVWLYCNTTIIQEVSWFKDNILLGKGYDFTDFNRSLHVASVSPDNTGQYWCQVSNGITVVKSYPVFLSVIYGPGEPIISPVDVCNEEHTNIILSCKADAFPQPQYAWYRDGVWLDDGRRLFIQNFSESQAGGYVCEAMNELLHQKTRSNIQHIRLKKSCVSGVTITGQQEGTEGKSTFLHCTAEGDDVVYSWTKGDQPVNENERISLTPDGQTLNFNPCNRSDAAQYTCHASNSFSSGDSNPFGLTIICDI
ncbi:carcinoembryonic antigen-related cell adhesion molecule 1-like [Pseudonaja textilis]|uniref:carcinoembryonic antigen-related cell adhesion molecule 1-like n=1 Tax=Pseudonaja textilis TaxID=8673 RepID=UPI000EAA3446|nr:carcinoembryonic antigen-related cell adhesion molecule 1-like [Pseudonaja textilis]